MNTIKVSVIIPVYNTRPFLEECLDSLCQQTLKEIEILCVDDGSQDGSCEVLEKYAKKDGRIRVLYNEHTGYGAASARNKGLAEASGEYLSFLDSDDYFDTTLLEKAYMRAKEANADIVMYDAQRFNSETREPVPTHDIIRTDYIPKKKVFSGEDFPDKIFLSTIGAAWCMLVKHEHVKNNHLYFQSLYHADDFFFTYSALCCAKRITVIYERLLFYRVENKKSQSSTKSIAPLAAIDACKQLKDWLEKEGLYPLYRIGFISIAARYFAYYVNTMEYKGFVALFDALKKQYLKEFELEDAKKEDFITESLYEWTQDMKQCERDEYLFKRLHPNVKTMFYYSSPDEFPFALFKREDRVVIYGAGNVGKSYYIQNIVKQFCNVVGWVDKNAAQMVLPVESIEILQNRAYDKILIAVKSPEMAQEIKLELQEMGIEEHKIVWSVAN